MKAVNLTILAGDEMTCQDAGQGRDRSKTPSRRAYPLPLKFIGLYWPVPRPTAVTVDRL